jgi:hypothetical protein
VTMKIITIIAINKICVMLQNYFIIIIPLCCLRIRPLFYRIFSYITCLIITLIRYDESYFPLRKDDSLLL